MSSQHHAKLISARATNGALGLILRQLTGSLTLRHVFTLLVLSQFCSYGYSSWMDVRTFPACETEQSCHSDFNVFVRPTEGQ